MSFQKSPARLPFRALWAASWFSAAAICCGCASRAAYVIARQDAQFPLKQNCKICVAPHAEPKESELALERDLLLALHQQGLTVVPSDQADFTLTYWLDDSWKPGKKTVNTYDGVTWSDGSLVPVWGPQFQSEINRRPGMIGDYGSSPVYQRFVDNPYLVQGIRLKLYPKNHNGRVEFSAAWEGYIEAGSSVKQSQQLVLLQTLVNYLGRDFNGRAPLLRQPP